MKRGTLRRLNEFGEWLGDGSTNTFGKPWAGKDSHAKRFARYLNGEYISSGDVLRKHPNLPPDIQLIMEQGDIIPTDKFNELAVPALGSLALRGKPLFLSSFGRKAGEEHDILRITEKAGHPIKVVIGLEISDEESLRRLNLYGSRDRADDTPEGLRNRHEKYREETLPVLSTYESLDKLVRVDASEAEDLVFDTIVHAVHEYAQSH